MTQATPAQVSCDIEGCDRPAWSRGWCNRHYKRMKLYGVPDLPPKPSAHDRFWSKVDKTSECWVWLGALDRKGYGAFNTDGYSRQLAHRVSYQWANFGPMPKVLDHQCHQPSCVRPEHLRPVTVKENSEHRAGATVISKTGILGVCLDKRTGWWIAQVKHFGRNYSKRYRTLAEAQIAVVERRNELFTHNDADRIGASDEHQALRDG